MSGDTGHRFLFYASEAAPASVSVEVTGDEYHHMARVLRLPVGEVAYVTNGRGVILRCRIEEFSRGATRLSVLGVEEDAPHPRPVTLALALLRKEAFERAVEQCTELGITECLPFVSERSHLKGYSAAFVDRLRRVALSAAKQSFRSYVPGIADAVAFEHLLPRVREATLAVVGDEGGGPLGAVPSRGDILVIVGPEGGLVPSERARLSSAGAVLSRVSDHRLRSGTAAAALVAAALSGGATGPA
jgi:16S rRNA (uracil1498-N3)-methyltransferase